MKTIHKFSLDIPDDFQRPVGGSGVPCSITVPKGARPLSAGVQQHLGGPSDLVVWALVDPEQTETEKIDFHVFGTGWGVADAWADKPGLFCWTVQTPTGAVWHIYRNDQ